LPLKLVFQPVLTRPEEIRALCIRANSTKNCGGLVLWMHTFSPSKMWIGGLYQLAKPFLHLHTQFNRDLSWGEIDMDFMNLNQAAHGDREAGHIHTRLRLNRKIVIGHWSDPEVQDRLATWMRVTRGWHDWQGARFARFADNMREVAVIEGDKVSAEARFGFSVNGYGIGDLVEYVDRVGDEEVTRLCEEYEQRYNVAEELRKRGCVIKHFVTAVGLNWACEAFWTMAAWIYSGGRITRFTVTRLRPNIWRILRKSQGWNWRSSNLGRSCATSGSSCVITKFTIS
jgi:L-arabinose isomerase